MMIDKKENLILSVSNENEAKIVVNKSIFIGIIRKVENREEVFKLLIKDTNSPLYNFIKSQ